VALVIAPTLAARLVPFMADFGEPVTLDVPLDGRVVIFSSGLALAAALVAGLAPAFATLARTPAEIINESSRGSSSGRATRRVRHALVIAQFAASLALVFVAALLTRTGYNLPTMPPRFHACRRWRLAVRAWVSPFPATVRPRAKTWK
jgi:hypothetical protein